MDKKILLVGCGKMGSALLGGWLGQGIIAKNVTVVEPIGANFLREKFGVYVATKTSQLDEDYRPGVVVFAVKPQGINEIVSAYSEFVQPQTVFLSIAAGQTITKFQRQLGDKANIIRCMPNTPAAVGRGITVACGNDLVTDVHRSICQKLLQAVGDVEWVDDEALLDPVTAVSGSGPAYVFYLMETLTKAGIAAGLEPALSAKLARKTVIGSAELAHLSAEAPEQLRQNVTSPGGTTAAALDVLMAEDGLQALMVRAVDAATKRSRELAG